MLGRNKLSKLGVGQVLVLLLLLGQSFVRGFPALPPQHWDPLTSGAETEGVEMGRRLLALQQNGYDMQKRGFGSMMPAYLINLYRQDLPRLTEKEVMERGGPQGPHSPFPNLASINARSLARFN